MGHSIWQAPNVSDGATGATLAGFGSNARRDYAGQNREAFATIEAGGWPMTTLALIDYLTCPYSAAVDGDRTTRRAAAVAR